MEAPGQRATLKDVLNYTPQSEFSDTEMHLIQTTFRENPALIAVLRKTLIPTISDPSLPIEQVNADPFLNRDWSAMPMDEAKCLIVARQDAVKFVIGGLVRLQLLANQPVETEMEAAARRQMNSSK